MSGTGTSAIGAMPCRLGGGAGTALRRPSPQQPRPTCTEVVLLKLRDDCIDCDYQSTASTVDGMTDMDTCLIAPHWIPVAKSAPF